MAQLDNKEVLRGAITTGDIGAVGSGLSGPDQFDAFFALAQESTAYLSAMGVHQTNSMTGNLPRISFADNLIEAAAESVDSGNYFEPTHSTVAYALTKVRFAAKLSNDALKFAVTGAAYEDQLNAEAAKAWGRALQRLLWMGDTTSQDPSLNINQGWRAQITAGGATVAGGGINGGNFAVAHLDAALQALPEAHAQSLEDYSWVMSMGKYLDINENLSTRATGMGDLAVERGPDGTPRLKGLPIQIVGDLGNDVVLCDTSNTTCVLNSTDFSLKRVSGGQFDIDDVFALVSFLWVDPIIKDAAGCSIVTGLN